MKFRMQALVGRTWTDICPSGGEPYEYDTREGAETMLRICYPDQLREERLGAPQTVRVREVA